MDASLLPGKYILSALVFSLLGLLILAFAMIVFDKLTPGRLWHHIIHDKNLPLAITVGAVILGISQIIASAIHG